MLFNLRRYLYALSQHSLWLVLAVLPLAVYLLITGIKTDRFTLSRSLIINPDWPVAITSSPVDTISIKSLAVTPKSFFTDRLALTGWQHYAETDPGLAKYNFKDKSTMLAAIEALSLSLDEEGQLKIAYFGPDAELGIELVNYYTGRILRRLRAGYHRQAEEIRKTNNFNLSKQLQIDKSKLEYTEHHAWWRSERLKPATQVTLIPLITILVIIGLREFLDTAFKSGRQAARYLNLPILGFMPSLDPIINTLQEGKSKSSAL